MDGGTLPRPVHLVTKPDIRFPVTPEGTVST